MSNASPTLPPVVLRLLISLAAIELIRNALTSDLNFALIHYLGFNLFRGDEFNPALLYGAVTSVLLHGGWGHLLSNAMWILVISPKVVPHIGGKRFLWFFVATGAVGALTHATLNWGVNAPLIGASGAVFGLLGAGAFVLIRGKNKHSRPSGEDVLKYVLLMMIINVGYALLGGGNISWEAHAGGFFSGMALFPLMRQRPPDENDDFRVVSD